MRVRYLRYAGQLLVGDQMVHPGDEVDLPDEQVQSLEAAGHSFVYLDAPQAQTQPHSTMATDLTGPAVPVSHPVEEALIAEAERQQESEDSARNTEAEASASDAGAQAAPVMTQPSGAVDAAGDGEPSVS